MVYVQLSEDGDAVIAVFACAQDVSDYPNQAELEESDSRYLEFLEMFGS